MIDIQKQIAYWQNGAIEEWGLAQDLIKRNNLLWRVAARTDSRIEPIAVGQRQFEEDDSSAIIEIAPREGQVVWLEG